MTLLCTLDSPLYYYWLLGRLIVTLLLQDPPCLVESLSESVIVMGSEDSHKCIYFKVIPFISIDIVDDVSLSISADTDKVVGTIVGG